MSSVSTEPRKSSEMLSSKKRPHCSLAVAAKPNAQHAFEALPKLLSWHVISTELQSFLYRLLQRALHHLYFVCHESKKQAVITIS